MPSIRPGDNRNTLPSIDIGPWNAKYAAEAISEVISLGGYDLVVIPTEPRTSVQVGGSMVAAPANVPGIGQVLVRLPTTVPDPGTRSTQPPVFEYGTTRANVASYSLRRDRDEEANQVFVPRIGYPEPGYLGAETTQSALDSGASTAFGRLQAWVEPGDVYLAATRLALANNHLLMRKGPRRRVTFTPAQNNIAEPFTDYDVGSWVRFRAFNGVELRLDVMVRIWAMNVSMDDNGNESVTVETVEGGG